MNEPVATPEKTPEERHKSRLRKMMREYAFIEETLKGLSDVIDINWVNEKFRKDDDIDDYARKMHGVNTALMNYVDSLQKNPDMLPDNRGGDLAEVKLCFEDIRVTVKMLERLLPPDTPTPGGFVERLGKEPEDVVLKQPNPSKDGAVAVKVPEEQDEEPKKKKKYKHGESYILPGLYESKIRLTIDALRNYAALAAPLVGVTLVQPYISDKRRPDEKIVELQEYSIGQRTLENPADYGVPEGWTKKLNFRFSLSEPTSTPGALGQ
jgi:hypothetical protein